MAGAMVRVSETARAALRAIARAEKTSMQAVVEKALEDYRRKRFLEQVNAAWGEFGEDPGGRELREEMKAWDATLMDGLEKEEFEPPSRRAPSSRSGGSRRSGSRTSARGTISNRSE